MAYFNTPDLLFKHKPTGVPITDTSHVRHPTPLAVSRTDPLPKPPSGPCGNDFLESLDCLRKLQAERRNAAYQENERKKEILHQRDLAHCRDVNRNRMVAESNELRELASSAGIIASQQVNVELIKCKQREKLNEKLAEFKYGAEYRSGDDVHLVEETEAERVMRGKQNDLKEAYEKQMLEKEKRMHDNYVALEEERKHIDKMIAEEAARKLDAAKTRMLEREKWQQVIRDFQDERRANKERAAEELRKENERIASFNTEKAAHNDGQKALRENREKVAELLRDKLVAEMRAKEKEKLERAQIVEELLNAENDEKEAERKRQLKLKKLTEREDLRDAVRESRESHRLREEKIKRDWEEYQDVLRQKAQADDHKAQVEAKIREDRQKAVVALLDQQREEHRNRAIKEKEKEAAWAAKEDQDTRLWWEFVDTEREKYLRKRAPELAGYLQGYHRFPNKKDDHLFSAILAAGGDIENGPLITDPQPLAHMKPHPGSTHEIYHNLQDARLAEIHGVGSR